MTHSIEFSLTPDDLSAFHRFHLRSMPKIGGPLIRWIIIILLLMIMFVILNRDRPEGGGARNIIVSVLIALVPVVFVFAVFCLFIRRGIGLGRDPADARRFSAQQRLSLIDDGMEFISEFGSTVLRWNGIHHVASTPEHLFVYSSSNSAHIVPARAFASTVDFQDFVRVVAAQHRMTPPLHSNCPNCSYSFEHAESRGCPECGWQREP